MALDSRSQMRSGALILALSALTLALGFAVQVALAATLGTGRQMDIYLVAITVPTLLAVMALAVFPSYLVPALKACAADGGDGATALAALVTRRSAMVAFLLILALEGGATLVVRAVAPGLAVAEAHHAALLLRIMLVGSFFDLLRGVLTAVDYSHERFFRPQLAPSLNHAALFASVLLLLRPFGLTGLAVGWSVGSLLMFLMVLPALREIPLVRLPRFRRSAGTASLGRGLLPIIVVAALAQLSPVVDRLVASLLPAGAISYLGYGSKLLEVIMRTVPMAAALAAFPALSAHAASGDGERLRTEAMGALRLALLGAVPLALIVLVFRVPLVQVLFQRGAFDVASTRHVAAACAWYAVAIVPATVAYVVTQVLLALRRPWCVAGFGAANLALTSALDLALARSVGFTGIAISYLMVAAIQALAMALFLHSRWRLFTGAGLPWLAVQLALACMAMGTTWIIALRATEAWAIHKTWTWLGFNVTIGVIVSAVVLMALANKEIRWVFGVFKTRAAGR